MISKRSVRIGPGWSYSFIRAFRRFACFLHWISVTCAGNNGRDLRFVVIRRPRDGHRHQQDRTDREYTSHFTSVPLENFIAFKFEAFQFEHVRVLTDIAFDATGHAAVPDDDVRRAALQFRRRASSEVSVMRPRASMGCMSSAWLSRAF